jgi:hypothetical protein
MGYEAKLVTITKKNMKWYAVTPRSEAIRDEIGVQNCLENTPNTNEICKQEL